MIRFQLAVAEAELSGNEFRIERHHALPQGDGWLDFAEASENRRVQMRPARLGGIEGFQFGVALRGLIQKTVGVVEAAELDEAGVGVKPGTCLGVGGG